MHSVKPNKLNKGDTIAIISPSYPAISLFHKRLERAQNFLKSQFGFNVVYAPNAGLNKGYIAGSAKQRAEDLNWAFANEEIKGIITAIGGLNSNAILPHVDFDAIKYNPKVFVGYSDVTALHLPMLSLSNLVTFYGPALFSEWGEYPQPFSETTRSFEKIAFYNKPYGEIKPVAKWTDEFLDWGKNADSRPRKLRSNANWKILNSGKAEGILFGGNVDTMNVLLGTKYFSFPEEDFIFFFEITHLKLAAIDRAIEQLIQCGLSKHIRGILFSKYHAYDNSIGGMVKRTTEKDFEAVEVLIQEKFGNLEIPIITRMDFGHTDPMLTIPIGIKASINNSSVRLTESAVS